MRIILCLFLFVYMCLLLPGHDFSFYGLCNTAVGLIVTCIAQFFFICFLQSRPPANKTILNRQLVINFFFKSVFAAYWFTGIVVGFLDLEASLLITLFAASTGRIMVILSLFIYAQVSASRMLVFLSPSTFHSLKVPLFQYISVLSILAVFAAEVFLRQVVFSPDKCDVDPVGIAIHSLPFNTQAEVNEIQNNSNTAIEAMMTEENASIKNQTLLFANSSNSTLEGGVKTCRLFPSVMILLGILLVLETMRVILAVWRSVKKITKKKKVSPCIQMHKVKYAKNRRGRANSVPAAMGANNKPDAIGHFRRLVGFYIYFTYMNF